MICARRVVKWATIRQQFAPTTGSDLALCRPFEIRRPECNSLGSRMRESSMQRRGLWALGAAVFVYFVSKAPARDLAVDGGLISYGPRITESYRQGGSLFVRCLHRSKTSGL